MRGFWMARLRRARGEAEAGVDARVHHVRRGTRASKSDASMLALDTCGEQAEKEENRRVPHVRLGHETTLHVSKIGLTRVTV